MGSPLVIWCNVPLSPDQESWLEKEALPHRVHFARQEGASNLSSGLPDPACREAGIAFGQPHHDDVLASESLVWIHLTSAGYTRYDREDVRQAVSARGIMTNSSGLYDDPCAQHLLSFMLAHSRRLYPSFLAQQEARWEYAPLRPHMRVLRGDKVLMVGWGAIARRLEALLQPFGVEVRGIRRNPRPEDCPHVFPMSALESHLPWADHVVNILPASPETEGVFHRGLFQQMKEGSAFYNIGRGDTVVQPDLVEALESGRLAAAYLDVVSPEPLPPDHFLWKAPRCHITHHLGGGLQEEAQALLDTFVENLKRFNRGEQLPHVIMGG